MANTAAERRATLRRMTMAYLNQIGLVLQLAGAGYLVWVAFRGWRVFKRFEVSVANGVTYDQLAWY